MQDLKTLDEFKITVRIPVAWADMDVLGHVNSSKYFFYFEVARIKYYEELGLLDYFSRDGIAGVVAKTECSYFIPLKYPDLLTVGAKVTELTVDSLIMEYYIKSCINGLSAIGEAEVVFFDFSLKKKISVPPDVVNKIKSFENSAFV